MKKIKLPIIEVKWKDHCWVDNKDLKSIKSAKPYIWHEIGYLIAEDKERVVFCQRITEGFDGKKNKIEYENATIILQTDILYLKRLTTKHE